MVNVAVPPEDDVAVVDPESVAPPVLTDAVTTTPDPPRFPITGRADPAKALPLFTEPG